MTRKIFQWLGTVIWGLTQPVHPTSFPGSAALKIVGR
jgi:hypothetical protein